MLLIGGNDIEETLLSAVHRVDLASGTCTVQPPLYSPHGHVVDVQAAARLTDGRIVCLSSAHMDDYEAVEYSLTQMLELSTYGLHGEDASWQWRTLPGLYKCIPALPRNVRVK